MASAPHSIFRILLATLRHAGAFGLALVLVCAAIQARLPALRVPVVSDKLDYLRAHRGEIDTVFIGSSRVYRAFDPAQFDSELNARGGSARSFNFGADGVRPPESFYVLREVLKLGLPLRRVFIELGHFNPKVNAANVGSARYLHWHDVRHTVLVLRHIAGSGEKFAVKSEQLAVHLSSFLARMTNFGRGPELLAAKLRGPQKTWSIPIPWKDHAGFEAQMVPRMEGQRRATYEAAVKYVGEHGLARTPVPPLLAGELRALVAEVRAAGAEPVFVITPTVLARENLVDLEAAGIDAPLIAFTDPRRHPGVFLAENHCDEEHLNATGAAEFTRALAEELAAPAR